jgi:BirA family transcriptional regulator, biotin operon repressor / biotin---[acetyl-CoA-carboxylase] ligase
MEIPFFDHVHRFKNLDSTLTKAKQLIINRDIQGNFLIIADKQTAGMGRKENYWHSPNGGLWVTAGLYNIPVKNSITIFIGLCIIKALSQLYPQLKDNIGIKWPNDIMYDGKKIGGILTTNHPTFRYLLAGIGINTNNTEFLGDLETSALALTTIIGQEIDNIELVTAIFAQFSELLPDFIENELTNLIEDYHRLSILENRVITIKTEFEEFSGLVSGITPQGAILLKLDNGYIQPFYSGTVVKGERNDLLSEIR